MELFLRKYFWSIGLALFAAGALLAAVMISTILSGKLNYLPSLEGSGFRPSQRPLREIKSPAPIVRHDIFSSQRLEHSAPSLDRALLWKRPADRDGAKPKPGTFISETDLDLELVAVMAANVHSQSMAMIRRGRLGAASLFRIGDELAPDARVFDIRRGYILLKRDGNLEKLSLWGDPRRHRARWVRRGRHPIRPTGPLYNPRNIKQIGRYEYVVAEAERRRQLGNLQGLPSQVRIHPQPLGRGGMGFKINWLKQGSLLTAIGFRRGDVIRGVNGEVIASLDQALEALVRLKTANRISVDLIRRGHRRTLSYSVVD